MSYNNLPNILTSSDILTLSPSLLRYWRLLTGQSFSVGVPNTWNILLSWSKSDSPGRNGTLKDKISLKNLLLHQFIRKFKMHLNSLNSSASKSGTVYVGLLWVIVRPEYSPQPTYLLLFHTGGHQTKVQDICTICQHNLSKENSQKLKNISITLWNLQMNKPRGHKS